ncbi:MAG: bifunctional alpha,alpha-trehalose-phosphate synthase (UDP-forming)/trehalose-phosphatase [Candidatus Methanoperedens sp.]|nr:bifunctional alpha,alpha-trehalose-phosphate synthase (UDP-forming)/trehalose-phosphatase [Candidatus Methanoperedens sp.]
MRLVIVSNRLPFTVVEKENVLKFKESVGGLVSGLKAYLDALKNISSSEYSWIGWPGISVDDGLKEKLRSQALSEYHAYPVFVPQEIMEDFYNGFCNKTVWPLFHYFPFLTVYKEDLWNQYRKVNEIFRDAVMEVLKPGDTVWIHDYHFMLLPGLLREKMPHVPIGFFLHIPFPSFEIFRLLPRKWRKEILEGVLGADLIGFHTQDYTQYFLRCVLRILGHEHSMGEIPLEDRVVKADTLPMGVDFQRFCDAVSNPDVQNEMEKLKKTLNGFKLVFSIDRLDYTKGILNRLQGYEIFLAKNPEWHRKVVLALVVVPSRTEVEQYQQMKKQIDELVGLINGRFGSIDWTPILYRYRFLPFSSLIAQYCSGDIALITPLRDGMNLVAKEYIATRTDGTGVLILSEMAGASKELEEAIIINPNHTEEIAEALKDALEMPVEEQIRRNRIMQERLQRYDVTEWVDDFVSKLILIKEEQKRYNAKLLDDRIKEQMLENFRRAKRRLILLDYDGTLVPFAARPELAKPGVDILELMNRLSNYPKTDVVLTSGRDRNTLRNWFGALNISFIAEHGVWIKKKNEEWRLTRPLNTEWKSRLLPVLEAYVDRVPGSFVENKEFSIVWHYRNSDPELASMRAKELMDDLVDFTANIDVQVSKGNKVIEVRNAGINKGTTALHFISEDYDFMLAIGDDWTDEDLFRILPDEAYSIKVRMTPSRARFNLHNHYEVISLLKYLIHIS